MDFIDVAPENAGISSAFLLDIINRYEQQGLAFHSLMLAKGDRVFLRAFWQPYNNDSLHRMYSVTKSFVGIAICELAAEGKIALNKPIISYFDDVLPQYVPDELRKQTVENMLTMQTCMRGNYWFHDSVYDRLQYYFSCVPKKEPGKEFDYDSDASFVLGCLVERITGKTLLDFLRDRCLNRIGFTAKAHTLKAPGGHTWSDSSLICKTEDIVRFARLLANEGIWDGEALLDADMVKAATKKHSDTLNRADDYARYGYGYQIWRNDRNGFSFFGMHGQFMHYDPKTDIIFACTSGNKAENAGQLIYDGFKEIVQNCHAPLPENPTAFQSLKSRVEGLKLLSLRGIRKAEREKETDNRIFDMAENPMGILTMSFSFDDDLIIWKYKNQQGDKELKIGRGENVFSWFPEYGYSGQTGGIPSPGNQYQCAASAIWETDDTIKVKVQVIDEYIGILDMKFRFFENRVELTCHKDAENFLNEYEGFAVGEIREKERDS